MLLAAGPAGLLLLVAAATQLVAGTLSPQVALPVGAKILLAGTLGLILVGTLPSIALLLVVLIIIGIGHGLTFMAALRQATAIAVAGEQAGTAAAFFAITYLGGSIPVIAVGLLATEVPLTTAVRLFAAAIACAIALVLPTARYATASRRSRRGKPPTTPDTRHPTQENP